MESKYQSKVEKGKEFEEKVANFFRQRGYIRVLLNQKVKGKSGLTHEVDILILDNLDDKKICWACQCKAWKRTVGIREIREWVETCRDISAAPAFISYSGFSSEAEKYARYKNIYLITWKEVELFSSFWDWRSFIDSVHDEADKSLYCLSSMYHTHVLQEALKGIGLPYKELVSNAISFI